MKRGFSGTKKPKQKKAPSIYEDFIPLSKARYPAPKRHFDVQPSALNTKQRKAYDLVEGHVLGGNDSCFFL